MIINVGTVPDSTANFRVLALCKATAGDWTTVTRWAADAGWNPGIGDARMLMDADPTSFRVGRQDDRLISAVSIVRYPGGYAHLGNLLVAPDMRGIGWGRTTLAAALPLAGERTIGADVPPDLTDLLGQQGFERVWRTIRYQGRPSPHPQPTPYVAPLERRELTRLAAMDAEVFPVPRHGLAMGFAASPGHHTLVYRRGAAAIQGYGVLRPAHQGMRIGPVYADSDTTAHALLKTLCDRASRLDASSITLDVPDCNPGASSVAEDYGLHRVSETTRMYRPGRHPVPTTSSRTCFALTSLETG